MTLREHRTDLGDVLQQVRAGDADALEELFTLCEPMMQRTARGIARTAADAEDAVQEAWARFLEHLTDIKCPDSVAAWLWQVTRNVARRSRARSWRTALDEPPTEVPADSSPEEDVTTLVVRSARCSAVGAAIAGLSPRDQELLSLLVAQDHPSYAAIGQRLGRPVGSIGPTRQRIIHRLRSDPRVRSMLNATADG